MALFPIKVGKKVEGVGAGEKDLSSKGLFPTLFLSSVALAKEDSQTFFSNAFHF